MSKKKLLSLSLVVIMIAILSLSSLAWFSDADSVTNNFQVSGGENQDPDEIFSVDVMEAVDADGDGDYDYSGDDKTIGAEGDTTSDGTFTYEHIVPGDMLFKRPSTMNTGSYDQYLRMKVTFNNAEALLNKLWQYGLTPLDMLYNANGALLSPELYTNPKYLLTQDTKWTYDGNPVIDAAKDTVTYTFYYNSVLEPEQSAVLFTWVNIPYQLTQDDMALFEDGKFSMVITGEAVQTDNLGVTTAWDAFAVVEQTQPIG